MANSLSASFPKYWSKVMQTVWSKTDVFRAICSFKEEATLKKGNIVDRPYRSSLTVNTLGSEGSYTRQDITDTSDTLTVDVEKEVSIYVRDFDALQSNYDTINEYAGDAAVALGNWIDGDVLGEYANASSVVGNYELGGGGTASDGIGVTATTSNIQKIFAIADQKLNAKNIPADNRYAVISPQFKQTLLEYLAGKESALGDSTGTNGHIGKYFGFDLYVSNNCGWSGRLEFGTLPTDGDTVVINGVTFTFKDSIGTTAGYTHIGASTAAVALDILVAAINTPGTSVDEAAAAGFVAVSAANQKLLKGITATDGTTYMTLKAEGKSYIAVSETLSAAADIWTTTKQIQHQLFGRKGAIDLVIQKEPSVKTKERDGYLGKDIVNAILYGLKTFNNMKDALVDVQTRSDAY